MTKLIFSYIRWHYSRAYLELFNHSVNFISFIYNFFGISVLERTLFAPWQMLGEKYKGGFNIGDFFSTLFLNTIMRLIGFLIRSVFILVGLLAILIMLALEIVAFILWTILPLLILALIISGLRNISK